MIEKPIGGELEYDALNRLVAPARELAIVARTVEIAADTVWGICRCRMAAIIEATARRMGWQVDQAEAQRRALIMVRWPGRSI